VTIRMKIRKHPLVVDVAHEARVTARLSLWLRVRF
jgi:hypothetical protein